MIGKKWSCSEGNTLQTVWAISEGWEWPWNMGWLVLWTELFHRLMTVRIIPAIAEKVKGKSLSHVRLFDMNCSLPGSSIRGILQARILEWVAISFSRDLPDPEIEPGSPALQADALGWVFPGTGPPPTFWSLMVGSELSWCLWVWSVSWYVTVNMWWGPRSTASQILCYLGPSWC